MNSSHNHLATQTRNFARKQKHRLLRSGLNMHASFNKAVASLSAQSLRLLAFACLTGLVLTTGHARQSDLTKAIDVRADKSEFDEKAGTQTLSGNVEITQGTMKIKADQIAISLKDNALSKIEGTGTPIQFEQENEQGELMQGEAKRIIYNALEGTLILQGSANLEPASPKLGQRTNNI